MRTEERDARAYCESIGADPDADVSGYFDTGAGQAMWLSAPRWTWYRGSNADWARPLTAYERAVLNQNPRRG